MAEVNLENLLNGVQGKFWNYGNPQKDGYMQELTGTLTKVSIAQAHEFGHPEQKSYWPDGNPVILLRMHVKDAGGEEYLFDIKPKSTMWFEDIQPACPSGQLSGVLGKLIKLSFQGLVQVPGRAVNRNKFQLQILGPGQFPNEGFDPTMPPTRSQAQGQQQPQQPQQQPAYSPQQYTAQQMVQPQQQAQQMYVQQQAQPQVANPQLAAAMQAAQQAGAQSQAAMVQQQFPGARVTAVPQQEQPPVDIYDQDIPF